jgi:hypothetical protein
MLFGAFQPPSWDRAAPPRSWWKDVPVTIQCISQQILLSGFVDRKALNSMDKISIAEVLRLRATSAVSRNPSVRRSAQDDDSVGEPEKKQQVAPLRLARDDKFKVLPPLARVKGDGQNQQNSNQPGFVSPSSLQRVEAEPSLKRSIYLHKIQHTSRLRAFFDR